MNLTKMGLRDLISIGSFLILPLLCNGDSAPAPIANLGPMGYMRGDTVSTVGNLGHQRKTFYRFQNIQYGQDVSGKNRFKQPTPRIEPYGDEATPFDATKSGPICQQGTKTGEKLEMLNGNTTNSLVANLLEQSGLIEGNAANLATSLVIDAAEAFFGGIDLDGRTVEDVLNEYLDVTVATSEECLHLAVSTPVDPTGIDAANADAELLPVMFYIHGGGFRSGMNLKMDASRLGDVADVVIVAINYRVGPLGFLCLEDDDAAGNMGMLDMVLALQWVQDNIHYFGGDRERVTIFGESAGSASIGHLVLSPLTEGLFSQGIGQSGSAVSPWAFEHDPEYHSRNLADRLNCNLPTHKEIVECLQDIEDASEITKAGDDYGNWLLSRGQTPFEGSLPCAQTHGDKKFYEANQTPEDLLARGDYRNISILFGANSHEGSYVYGVVYNGYVVPNDLEEDVHFLTNDFINVMLKAVGIEHSYALVELIEEFYFEPWQIGDLEFMTPGMLDLLGTFFLKASSYQMVQENSQKADSFWYSLEHPSSKKSVFNALFPTNKPAYIEEPGVCHGDELMYLFNLNLPVLLCDLTKLLPELVTALKEGLASGECSLPPRANFDCIVDPSTPFRKKWGTCVWGELTPEEQVWSDKLVKAWTNFAVHGTPTPEGQDDLPHLPAWSHNDPKYLAFRPRGPVIASEYTHTYNQIMTQSLTEAPPTDQTPDGASSIKMAAVVPVSLAMGVLAARIAW